MRKAFLFFIIPLRVVIIDIYVIITPTISSKLSLWLLIFGMEFG